MAQLLGLEGQLARLPDVAATYGPATVLNQTAKGAQNLLVRISGRRDMVRNLAEQRAKQRGSSEAAANAAGDAAMAKFDRRYGSLLVRGMPAGLPTLRNSRFVATVLYDKQGEPHTTVALIAELVVRRSGIVGRVAGVCGAISSG
ncbi:hypothetical protein SAMN06265360_14013 [Haloechinothrix alba]|uniref:Uncharacterized protein n=1 Tax=Haloechinothrix alba TaxID=664784 RepID=A0A239AH82_9PSEU|nr:hypothetical protein [Haloechinothrix alba]SNR94741.1 hypothetical protein SAMN06265360_14013 [Haloechinothrix alba]